MTKIGGMAQELLTVNATGTDGKGIGIGDWRTRHNNAVKSPVAFEIPILMAIDAWLQYRLCHLQRYESRIGDDMVLGISWVDWGLAIRFLLNGETGRLDCGTLDALLVRVLSGEGVEV